MMRSTSIAGAPFGSPSPPASPVVRGGCRPRRVRGGAVVSGRVQAKTGEGVLPAGLLKRLRGLRGSTVGAGTRHWCLAVGGGRDSAPTPLGRRGKCSPPRTPRTCQGGRWRRSAWQPPAAVDLHTAPGCWPCRRPGAPRRGMTGGVGGECGGDTRHARPAGIAAMDNVFGAQGVSSAAPSPLTCRAP